MLLSRQRMRRASVLTAAAALGVVLAPAAGMTATSLSFDATADATAGRYSVTIPGAPAADTIVDLGGSRAEARLSSNGDSTGRAAAPYPGEIILGLPGLANTFGVPAEVPPYPAFAQSNNPTQPEQEVVVGGALTLLARSGAEASQASTVLAPDGAPASTTSAVVQEKGGSVTATAVSEVRSVEAGPVKIAAVTSKASATRDATGLTTTSSTTVTGLSVTGQALTVDDRGIMLAGTTIPLEQAKPLLDALKQAGVTLELIEPSKSDEGIVSGGLRLAVTQAVPALPGAPAVETVTVALVAGQVSAFIPGAAFTDPEPAAPGTDFTVEPAGPVGPPLSGAADSPLPPTDAFDPAVPDSVAAPLPAATDPGPAPETAEPVGTRSAASFSVPDAWSASFYLAVAAGAVLTVLALTLVRLLGVRYT
jgi:hypothetical protein